jgi:hypothetical protein
LRLRQGNLNRLQLLLPANELIEFSPNQIARRRVELADHPHNSITPPILRRAALNALHFPPEHLQFLGEFALAARYAFQSELAFMQVVGN